VQTDWQPKRASLQSCVSQDPTDQKQSGESGRDQERIGKLNEGMGDRIEPGGPGHLRRRSFGRFQKMDDGIQRRRDKDRHIPLPGF